MLKIKKWIGLALTLTMLVAAPLPAGAATTVTAGTSVTVILDDDNGSDSGDVYPVEMDIELTDEQKQALEKIYEIIPELKELTEIGVSRDERSGTWHVWLHEVQDQDMEKIFPFTANANLTFADDTGELLELNLSNPAWASEEMPSQQLAYRQADAFIKQLLGDKAEQCQIGWVGGCGSSVMDPEGNEISWQMLSVNYYLLVNGLPFLDRRGIRVDVDVAGHVTGYYDDWYGRDQDGRPEQALNFSLFPPAQAAVSQAEAEKSLAEKTTMQLTYLPGYPSLKQDSPLLAYMIDSPGYIDAQTGELVEMFAVLQQQQEQVKLIGQGEEMAVRNRWEAEALLSRQLGVDMGKMDFWDQPENNFYWGPDGKMISYSWHMSDEGEPLDDNLPDYVSLQTLADSGEVISFNLQDYSIQDKQVALSQEHALTTALCFMEKVLPAGETEMQLTVWPAFSRSVPDWVDQTLLDQEYLREPLEVRFYFGRMEQGIPIYGAGYSVTVSLVTGEITNYSKHDPTMPAAWPDGSQAVPAEQAKAEYLRKTPLQLAYIWPEWFGQRAPAPRLVYTNRTTTDWYFIDALTGTAVLFDLTEN